MKDKSNKCQRCGHSYVSITHQRRCMGRSGGQLKRRGHGGRSTHPRGTASDVLHFGAFHSTGTRIVADGSFYAEREAVAVQS